MFRVMENLQKAGSSPINTKIFLLNKSIFGKDLSHGSCTYLAHLWTAAFTSGLSPHEVGVVLIVT